MLLYRFSWPSRADKHPCNKGLKALLILLISDVCRAFLSLNYPTKPRKCHKSSRTREMTKTQLKAICMRCEDEFFSTWVKVKNTVPEESLACSDPCWCLPRISVLCPFCRGWQGQQHTAGLLFIGLYSVGSCMIHLCFAWRLNDVTLTVLL